MMFPKHSNPTRPRQDTKNRTEQWAHAPYNFVPLPETIVPAPRPLPDHNAYYREAAGYHTGWIECDLETMSPTYIRGMLTETVWKQHRTKQEAGEDLDPREKEEAAPFFSIGGEEIEGREVPVPRIPGSSLRGMIRMLVEIVGYGRVRWVGNEPTITFRAFAPPSIRTGQGPDLADAIFGWVEEKGVREEWVWGPQQPARAGRVFFGDAHFEGASDGVWYASPNQTITPRILGQPKPTTFQHYLVQAHGRGHTPDNKSTLAHYGTPTPDETVIRGHKLYWHKGAEPDIKATAKELERKPDSSERKRESQLTSITPLRPGVHFRFRIAFENLRDEELGALLWTLALPGEPGKAYYHKLGMGKPLGMGAVKVTPHLYTTDREARYQHLFAGEGWAEAVREADIQPFIECFDQFVRDQIGSGTARLADEERIQMLLAMLEWREGTNSWRDLTRYMEIEYGPRKLNEYKERPVLPDPLAVSGRPSNRVGPSVLT
ncbi:MAG: TIGR03986 family type III CRISPR-associated RAMP protein, partial [Ardenticatenaceae bacterium]